MTTSHKGRRPLGEGHVAQLTGSEYAKARLRVLLRTLQGAMTIPEACVELNVCESRFHALRSEWLQEALQLLEPRRVGRPPKCQVESSEVAELRALVVHHEQRAELAETRHEVDQILGAAPAAAARDGAEKNVDAARAKRLDRRRRRRERSRRQEQRHPR